MPSNTRSAYVGEQHAVLEGARLALVGVADDDTLQPRLRGALRQASHFSAGGEAGAAAAAQVGALDFVEHRNRAAQAGRQAFTPGTHVGRHLAVARRPRPGSPQGVARLEVAAEQDVGAPDVVLDLEVFSRPLAKRHLAADQFGDLVDARRGRTRATA